MLRRQLLPFAADGSVYVPFCGDGDIAVELYGDRKVYAADIDADRVAICADRINGQAKVADCDSWPFGRLRTRFALADFDSYAYPYASFRAFWAAAQKQMPMVMFFTDAQRQIIWHGISKTRRPKWTDPDGVEMIGDSRSQYQRWFNCYWIDVVLPWLREFFAPLRVVMTRHYLRSMTLCYWGVVIDGTDAEIRRHEKRKVC